MSSEAVWFFLKDQETVGPFSKETLKEKHAGGEFQPDSMVWREGMEGWQPASAIADLDVFAAPAPPVAPAPATPPAAETAAVGAPASGSKFKLKLKSVSKPASTQPSTVQSGGPAAPAAGGGISAVPTVAVTPAPTGPIGGPKAFLLEGEKKGAEKKPVPKWKQILLRIFSSLIWVPLFMVASGAIVWLFQVRFPNVLWFVWLVAGFGVISVFSLFGLHWFDKWVRFLAILLLLPPVLLLWPIVTSSGVKNVPAEYWWFTGYCFCYGLVIRMGLRDYLSWGMAGFLCVIGLGVVGFEVAVAKGIWEPPEWQKLVDKGSSVRLPAMLVRMASLPPHLASSTGKVELTADQASCTYPIERAVLKKLEGRSWQLMIQLVDGQVLGAALTIDGEFDREKVVNQDWEAIFSKDESLELQAKTAQWKMQNDKTVTVGAGVLSVGTIDPVSRRWSGSVKFYSSAEKANAKGEPDVGRGVFDMDVEIR